MSPTAATLAVCVAILVLHVAYEARKGRRHARARHVTSQQDLALRLRGLGYETLTDDAIELDPTMPVLLDCAWNHALCEMLRAVDAILEPEPHQG